MVRRARVCRVCRVWHFLAWERGPPGLFRCTSKADFTQLPPGANPSYHRSAKFRCCSRAQRGKTSKFSAISLYPAAEVGIFDSCFCGRANIAVSQNTTSGANKRTLSFRGAEGAVARQACYKLAEGARDTFRWCWGGILEHRVTILNAIKVGLLTL